MGIFDKAKDALSDHDDKVDAGVDRAGDFVDDKTDSKYANQVDQAQDYGKDATSDHHPGASDPPA
jgi:hypothetical protein